MLVVVFKGNLQHNEVLEQDFRIINVHSMDQILGRKLISIIAADESDDSWLAEETLLKLGSRLVVDAGEILHFQKIHKDYNKRRRL
jgi:hypothetical protein